MMRFSSSSKQETCLKPVYPTRQWDCPHCQSRFEAARRAMTLKCPSCARPIQFQDVVFNRATTESLTTLGSVRITRRGSVDGNISCGELLVQGVLNGSIHVRGRAIISSKASVSGTLCAHAMSVEAGGSLHGSVEIVPPPKDAKENVTDS